LFVASRCGSFVVERGRFAPSAFVQTYRCLDSKGVLGDVILANAAVCRLIEFKRVGKLTSKEKKKRRALRYGIDHYEGDEDVAELSRQVHWYVEIQQPKVIGDQVVCRACPYLDFESEPDFISINEFAGAAAEEAYQEQSDKSQRKLRDTYIKWVCETFASIEEDARADAQTAGAVIHSTGAFLVAITDEKETVWIAVPDIRYALLEKEELAETLRLRVTPDIPKHEEKISERYRMRM